jgi:uncharacterized protein YeaO (DUF488 family)
MIKVKHFTDRVERSDGQRIWVEPIGITKDLAQLCAVHHVLSHLGPPTELANWYEAHPDGYEYFRGRYHEHLGKGPFRQALAALARAALSEDFTLLHHGDDPEHNTATALYEFLIELQAYKSPDQA